VLQVVVVSTFAKTKLSIDLLLCLFYQVVFPELFMVFIFSEILILDCPLRAVMCKSESVEGLSVETVTRDEIVKFSYLIFSGYSTSDTKIK
jgi:hypothetical protein